MFICLIVQIIKSSFILKYPCLYAHRLLKVFLSFLPTVFMTVLVAACSTMTPREQTQDRALYLTAPPHQHFKQIAGNAYHPNAFYTYGEISNPCLSLNKIPILNTQTRFQKATNIFSTKRRAS